MDRYDSEGKESSMASVSSGMSPSSKSGSSSMYSDRVSLSHILKNPSFGEEKVIISVALHCKEISLKNLICDGFIGK